MSGEAVRKAWLVAASIGAVETSKDQGVARWNGPLRELHHKAETKLISSYRETTGDGSSPSTLFTVVAKPSSSLSVGEYKGERRNEYSMKKVMEMSCFGPNCVRF